MRYSTILAPVLLALAGCGPMSLYYKEGVSVQAARDAETICKIGAVRDVPVRNVTRTIPGRFVPPRKTCDPDGHCQKRGGYYFPPEFITVDVNEELRKEAVNLCMRQQGYEFMRLPACKPNIVHTKTSGATRHFPKLTPQACVIRNKGGTWQIVSP